MKTYAAKLWSVSELILSVCANRINNCSKLLPEGLIEALRMFQISQTLFQKNRLHINRSRINALFTLPAVVPGFEPGQTEPKPVVLPLHHTTIAL